MKIIGKTRGGYIIEADEDELANLIGFYSCGCDAEKKLTIGSQINVSEMYRQMYHLHNNKGKLVKLAKELREYASILEEKDPIVPNIQAGEPK